MSFESGLSARSSQGRLLQAEMVVCIKALILLQSSGVKCRRTLNRTLPVGNALYPPHHAQI